MSIVTTPNRRAARRPSSEVRRLVLAAAEDLFVRLGYDATTTKAIADRAEVSERLIYSNFGTKEDLFREAVVSPFDELIDRYVAAWADSPADTSVDALMALFVRGFFELARRNRALLLSCVTGDDSGGERPQRMIVQRFATAVQGMREAALAQGSTHGLRKFEASATIAASAGMVLSVAVLDDLLFPPGHARPSADQLIEEMVTLICHGIVEA
ncbi:MAG TPA: TetR/AcrR family transcriptional regulator [Pseudonocardia sp.]